MGRRHISPTNVRISDVYFQDGSMGYVAVCNTCGWEYGTRSPVEIRQRASCHILRWHGSGTIEHKNFHQEVERNETDG